jgi:PPOX class probable F420-dependent enzyme
MTPIPKKYLDLFQKKSFAHLATVMPDGSPQVTPVWVDYDNQHIVINSARGRVKDRNMSPGAKVAIEIMDAEDPYRYIQVRGHVAEITEEGAEAHIDMLSRKYKGEGFKFKPGEVRVIYKITADALDLH